MIYSYVPVNQMIPGHLYHPAALHSYNVVAKLEDAQNNPSLSEAALEFLVDDDVFMFLNRILGGIRPDTGSAILQILTCNSILGYVRCRRGEGFLPFKPAGRDSQKTGSE